jgi:CTP:molybdopterin cytidylyltransferase MocA
MAREAALQAVLNDAPETGLSVSLRLGLEDLQREGRAAAALIFLGDQPQVRLDVVEALVAAWHRDCRSIIRPRYAARPDVPGHPVLLSRGVWSRVRQIQGDVGFSALRDTAADDSLLLDVGGDNPDIDTPADLQQLQRAFP